MKELKVLLFDIEKTKIDDSIFSLEDKKQLEQYTNDNVRREKTLSLYVKREYIGEYFLNESGKPLSKDKFFNISHKDQYLVFVIDEVPVGVDIEHVKPVKDGLINFIASEEEKAYIKDKQSFYEIWTSKEAITKANGKGIKQKIDTIPSLPLDNIHTFEGKTYCNRTVVFKDYVITVSRESHEDYRLTIEEIK